MFINLRSDREGLSLEELENARDDTGNTTDSSSSSSDEEMFSTNLEVTELMIIISVL